MTVSAQLVCNAQHCPGSQAELSISGISGMKAVLNGVLNADRRGWVRIMKGTIGKNAYYFNSHRMMRRYATEAYIR